MAFDPRRVRGELSRLMNGFTTGQKATFALATVGLLIGLFLFTQAASKPTYAPLFTDLEPSDAAAITQKLGTTPYKLEDGGRTVMVPKDKVYQLRLDMSAQSLPTGGSSGYALLDKQGITTSEFRQRVDYQRAMEGELARTIQAIDGVRAATVHLVIPAEDPFAEDQSIPSASVLVRSEPGKTLSGGQAQTIVNLIAGSVEGLKPDHVTVADAKGVVLASGGEGGTAQAASDARTTATRAYEQQLSDSVQEMLTRVVGAGHAVVRVSADLDFDARNTTTESYDTTNADKPINESASKETYTGTGSVPGGVLGSDTGMGATGGTNSNYSKDVSTRNYAVGKTVESTKGAPGSVKRLSVAVLLDSKTKGVDTQTVEKLVTAAAGISTQRGDTVAVDRMPFDDTAEKAASDDLKTAEADRQRAAMINYAKTGATILLAAVLVFFLLRSSKKERRFVLDLPPDPQLTAGATAELVAPAAAATGAAAAIEAPAEANALERHTPLPQLKAAPDGERSRVQSEIGELIERQPDEVAQLLRNWLADRRG